MKKSSWTNKAMILWAMISYDHIRDQILTCQVPIIKILTTGTLHVPTLKSRNFQESTESLAMVLTRGKGSHASRVINFMFSLLNP